MPWREWYTYNTLGAVEADKASAVSVLQGLHEGFNVTEAAIDIMVNNKARLIATQAIEPWTVWLPPCGPKQSKAHELTDNINAVRLDVVAYRTAVATANAPDGSNVLRAKSFYLVPEFKSPKARDEKSAVAASHDDSLSADRKWQYDCGGPDTMPPLLGCAACDKVAVRERESEWYR